MHIYCNIFDKCAWTRQRQIYAQALLRSHATDPCIVLQGPRLAAERVRDGYYTREAHDREFLETLNPKLTSIYPSRICNNGYNVLEESFSKSVCTSWLKCSWRVFLHPYVVPCLLSLIQLRLACSPSHARFEPVSSQ